MTAISSLQVSERRMESLLTCTLEGTKLHCHSLGSLPYVRKELDQIRQALGRFVTLVPPDPHPMDTPTREWVQWVMSAPLEELP
ncbi:MAG: hypothetical protein GTO63_22690 [Anaerolineae bacterium]|nr:hypothetical protein [Anaerolineae bacterium]NIN96109.1 hypothetical protein [Anaerolineae bacterium]NIQ80529.1 hypothetical protein [Anaerolineae bacterium]